MGGITKEKRGCQHNGELRCLAGGQPPGSCSTRTSMDAALATQLTQVGFDPATGRVAGSMKLLAEPIQRCADHRCSTDEDMTSPAAA